MIIVGCKDMIGTLHANPKLRNVPLINDSLAMESLLEGTTSAATMETDLDNILPSLSVSSAHQLVGVSGGREESMEQLSLTISDEECSSAVAGKGIYKNRELLEMVATCTRTCMTQSGLPTLALLLSSRQTHRPCCRSLR